MALQFLPDGAFDPAFDGDGVWALSLAGGVRGLAITATADGVLIAGQAVDMNWPHKAGVIVRLSRNGQLDPDFGNAGIVLQESVNWLGGYDFLFSEVRQLPSGKLLGLGTSNSDGYLWRWSGVGVIDPAFGEGGELKVYGVGDVAVLAFADNGRFYRIREEGDPPSLALAVEAFDANGQVITGYGDGGTALVAIDTALTLLDAEVRPDGGLYVLLGRRSTRTASRLSEGALAASMGLLLRVTAEGAIDSTFGTNGELAVPAGSAAELLTQEDGGVLVVNTTDVVRLAPSPITYRLSLPQLQRP